MRRFWILLSFLVHSSRGTIDTPQPERISCPLTITGDQLLGLQIRAGLATDPLLDTSPYVVEMIVDTGAKDSIIMDPRIPATMMSSTQLAQNLIPYQFAQFSVTQHGTNQSPLVTVGCNVPIQIPENSLAMAPALKQDLGETIKGILGFNQDKFRDNNVLFLLNSVPDWYSVAIHVPSVLQPHTRSDASITINRKVGPGSLRKNDNAGPYLHVNSKHYWSTVITRLKMIGENGNEVIITAPDGKQFSVIFDTGSNYFWATSGIWNQIDDAISAGNKGFVIDTKAYSDINTDSDPFDVSLRFPSDETGDFDKNLNRDFTVQRIDQSRFDDLAKHEILVVGTLGLRGKTLRIFAKDSSPKRGEFVISVMN